MMIEQQFKGAGQGKLYLKQQKTKGEKKNLFPK